MLNITVPTDSPEMVNGVSINSQVNTPQAQPCTLRARTGPTGTLQRAATMFTHEPLASPPTVLQSLKAIILASCSFGFFVTREFSFECAARVKYPPTMYTHFSVYSSRSLCTRPDLFIEQWALHFALPSSSLKDALVFVCEFPRVTSLTTHCSANLPVAFISFIPFHCILSPSVFKIRHIVRVILIRPRLVIVVCHRRIINASWQDTSWPLECHSCKIYFQ